LNERIETQLRTKDQEIEDLKAAAIREKIEMTKTEKDYELQIEALKTAMKENEKIIEQSGIKDLSIIIREKDKAIAELQELIMGSKVNEFEQKMKHDLEASSDPESQIKYLNIIISEKDKTIAELNEKIGTLQKLNRMKNQEIEDIKTANEREKIKFNEDLELQISKASKIPSTESTQNEDLSSIISAELEKNETMVINEPEQVEEMASLKDSSDTSSPSNSRSDLTTRPQEIEPEVDI
uniref:Uncharacterized protein n=1 Tax=Amphimedon queenslandica TaxID=400682 RepID=A0A1X7SLE4_AMPQE